VGYPNKLKLKTEKNKTMNNQNEIPANAGNQPTTHETTAAWRPVVEIPTDPATIETPVKNSDGWQRRRASS
jgi:hypothetical protein